MEQKEQLISDISDLNQLLTEELYWWTLENKSPEFNPKNILEISRNIHEKTFLLFHEFGISNNIAVTEPTINGLINEPVPEFSQAEETIYVAPVNSEIKLEPEVELTLPPTESVEEEVELKVIINDNSNQNIFENENANELSSNEATVAEFIQTETLKKEIPLGDQLMNKGIDNINSAIGISEKFLFIHELFKGNTERYMAEISKLNDFKTGDLALTYFAKLTEELAWDVKSHAFLELKKLLHRKYH